MRHVFTLMALMLVVSASVEAQTSVTLTTTVSETVTLSVPPAFTEKNVEVVSSGPNTVHLTLSGNDVGAPIIRVPLLVRSNSGFKISASFESTTAELSQLLVSDSHATGTLVSPQVVNALNVRQETDPDVSRPWLVLSGPRVSLGGTLNSPNNALQVTLVIALKPQPARDWMAQLTLVATPE